MLMWKINEWRNTMDNQEEIILKWQYGRFGDFFTLLMKAISCADKDNLTRLKLAFPDHVTAYERYTTESEWWSSVQAKARALQIIPINSF